MDTTEQAHIEASDEQSLPHGDAQLCSVFHRAVEFIGRRWTGAILSMLIPGPRRFNELLAAIPALSDRLLTERLRDLEAHGLVERHVYPGPPVRVEYELTLAGQDLQPVIQAITDWGEKWLTPLP